MVAELVLAPEIEQDVSEAYDWYENLVTVYAICHTARDADK